MRGTFRFPMVLAFALALVAPSLWAQSNVSTGEVLGTVKDAEGGVLPGATVEIKNSETGLVRRAVTNAQGAFRFEFLPVGTYEIRAELSGFRPESKQGIRVSLGASVRIEFSLSVGTLAEEVTVTAAAPLVETTRPDVANAVGEIQIANLPLNGRDFLDFIALTPQSVVDENGRAHIGGMRGIQNNFNIDGANSHSSFFGEERGGTRPAFTFSQGAIKEFQVIPSSYNVQFGNASGGIINAITKSGTNQFKLDSWYYFRDESMVETAKKPPAGSQAPKRAFEQHQYGLAVGGPVIKDRLHYFLSYDGQRRDMPLFIQFRNFPAGREADFESRTGLKLAQETNRTIIQTNDVDVLLGKLDWQLSANVLATLRHNYTNYEGENATSDSIVTGVSNNGLEKNEFHSSVLNINAVLGSNMFNELILQYANEERPRLANNTSIPEVAISSDAFFGQNNFLPNNLIEERKQVANNFSYYLDKHGIKAGFNVEWVSYDDLFYRYQAGRYFYRSWSDFFSNRPSQYIQAFSNYGGRVVFDTDYYAGYLQDEWKPTPNLTMTAGLRYDFQDNPKPQEVNSKFPATGKIPDDKDNWAPRIGFAWDPFGEGKTVVRGGFGYFYDITPTLLTANAMLTNGIRVVRVTLNCTPSQPCPTFPNRYPSLGALPITTPDLFVFAPGYENPQTKRFSLGVEQELGGNYALGGEFIWSYTTHLERLRDLNLVPVGYTEFGTRYYSSTLKNYRDFGRIGQFTDDAEARYWAIVLKARKRWADRWMFDASYTYSKWRDNNSNERTVSIGTYGAGDDHMNIMDNWGPGDYDLTHKFVLSAVVLLPFDIQLSTIATVRSGFPFTPTDGRDLNNDTYTGDRAYWNGKRYGRNSFRQPYFRNVDLRLSKIFRFGAGMELEVIGEVFNLFDASNFRTSITQMVLFDRTRNVASYNPDFGRANISGAPRQYQVGLKFRL
ncbi:MAG: TonB-dependent receptor [Thermoanaerobaculum sp.]|nr:TonB-dependent receptor [Thermoanaerobaculum sp.]